MEVRKEFYHTFKMKRQCLKNRYATRAYSNEKLKNPTYKSCFFVVVVDLLFPEPQNRIAPVTCSLIS